MSEEKINELLNLGFQEYKNRDYDKALEYNNEALRLANLLDNKELACFSLINFGTTYMGKNEYDEAEKYLNQALNLCEHSEKKSLLITVLTNLGWIYQNIRGNYKKAIQYYQEAEQTSEDLGDVKNRRFSLSNIGSIYTKWGKFDEASRYFQQSLELSDDLSDKAWVHAYMADMEIERANYGDALEYCHKAIQMFGEINEEIGESYIYHSYGRIYDALGRHEKALENFNLSSEIGLKYDLLADEGRVLISIGEVYQAWRKYDKALECYRQATQITEDLGDKLGYGCVLDSIGKLQEELGNYEESIDTLQQSRQIFEEMGSLGNLSVALNHLGLVFQKTGNYKEATIYYQKSMQIKKEVDDMHGLSSVLNNIGKLEREQKNYSKAIYNHKEALEIVEPLDAIHDIAIYSKELAIDYKEMNKNKKALENFEKSLSHYREILVKTPIEYQKAFESEFEELYDMIEELDEIIDKSDEVLSPSTTDDIRKIFQMLEKSDIEGMNVKIENMRSILGSWTKEKELASEYPPDISIKKELTVFVSYVTRDAEPFKIKEIANTLNKYERIKKVLYWERDTEDNIQKYMSDSLNDCDVLLLFCSPNALVSKPVEDEWTAANTMRKPIIPIFNDANDIPPLLKPRNGVRYNIFDLQNNIDNIYELIIRKTEKLIIDKKDLKTDL